MEFERKNFVIQPQNIRQVCQNCTLCARMTFCRKTDYENNLSRNNFRISDGNIPGLRQKISGRFISSAFNLSGETFQENHCWKQTISQCFSDLYAFQFFGPLRKILLAGLSKLNSTCPQDCLHGRPLFGEILFKM